MLTQLLGSEQRVKIINLFLLHSETKHELSQVARDLKLPANLVRREIDHLIKFGLLNVAPAATEISPDTIESDSSDHEPETAITKKNKTPKKADKKFFEINKNHILYPEINALFFKAQILSSQKFILSLEKTFQPKLLILTGFFTNYPEAQTDILIVGRVKRPTFLKLVAELEKNLGRELNFTILEEKEFRYRQEIMDIFLYNILEGKIITLINSLTH
ncbi:MAG: hypothetical protein WC467_01610 [Patescibacteria group bacterium]